MTAAFVRNVWKDGIQYAQDRTFDGVNPFKMGVVAASDSHTGVMGWHPENADWPDIWASTMLSDVACLDDSEQHRRALGGMGGGELA